MSFVSAKNDGASAHGIKSANRFRINAFNSAGTDYSTDPTHSYVYDSSMEALETVNMILCLMDQTGSSAMVNKGAYIALVNENKCEQGRNQSSAETGQSSGTQVTQFSSWVINSTRASNSAPQIVHIWVPSRETDPHNPEDSSTILVEVIVNEGANTENPYGDFTLTFKGVVDAGQFGGTAGSELPTMRGTLTTVSNADNFPQFKFVSMGGNYLEGVDVEHGYQDAANVILDDLAGTGGKAVTKRQSSFDDGMNTFEENETFAVAFDSSHLLRGKDTDNDSSLDAQQCLSRELFNTNVWRYNLYHRNNGTFKGQTVTAGQRVKINSGFPFRYDSNTDGTDDAHGWVGYWGVWTERGQLADGTTVTRFDYGNNTTSEMRINVSPGKMVRRIASLEPLADFRGDQFNYWASHPTLSIFGQWAVTVDNSNDFIIFGSVSWGDNGPVISETVDHDNDPGTPEVSAAATISLFNGQSLWLWSDAMRGNIVYAHDEGVSANLRQVTLYAQEFVSPGDTMFGSGSIALYCYDRCLKGGLTQSDVNGASSESDLYYHYAGAPFQYTLSANNGKLTLTDNLNNQSVNASNLDFSNMGFNWGISSGEMIDTPLADPSRPWDVYSAAISYRWETGANNWNRLVTASDSNNQVMSFDPPLRFAYTHSTGNDANGNSSYNGKKFMLEYGGNGNLWGFPWVEDPETRRWYSAVTLASGVVLTDDSNEFVVKAMEQEQSMQVVDLGECSGLDVEGALSDPELALPTLSDINDVYITLAGKPNVTAPPAVIDGEVQN
jgi:hypothetical protein